ncbi:ABC transporter substrate-binding protein [Pseudonocardia saturnea]
MSRRTIPATLLVAALTVTLAACGGGGGGTAPAAEGGVELVNEGQLTWCTSLPYEPFEFQQGDEVVGFEVDLMALIGERLGVTPTVVVTAFEGIQSGTDLTVGNCDIAAAAMTITPTREENFDFSEPYFDASQALLARADSGITTVEQLAGRNVGVQNGTTGQTYAQENIAGANLIVFEDLGLLTTSIQTGQTDAVINDNGPLLRFATQNPEFTVVTEFDTGEQYGMGVRTGNTALLDVVNEVLATSRTDGSYDAAYEKWFGSAAPAN